MKPLAKNLSSLGPMRAPARPGANGQTIRQPGAGHHECPAPACAANYRPQTGPGQLNRAANKTRGATQRTAANPLNQRPPVRAASGLLPKSPNYRVQTPIPLGGGSQQIRATIQGTPQIAGSVEMSSAGAGRVYISNLKVDQQHRRRGVAAQLIDAAIATARRQGFRAASLEARPSDNGISPQALVAMYRRQGFKSVGKSSRGSPLMERKL